MARGIRFCRTFLHVVLVRKHTDMRVFWLAQRAKKCDMNHIPQATAYCADQQIQINYLSKNRMSAQIQMAFCKCLETIAGMNLSQSQPKFTRNVKNAKTCIGWASIYFWVMDCFSNMPLKITIFCVIEQPWHQHALEKSVPKTSSPLFFWGLDCWWVSSKQCVMLNSF